MSARGAGTAHPPAIHEAGIYRIRVEGRLGPEWGNRLQGFSVEVRTGEDGGWRTDLTGTVADHAALMGILDRLVIHGARLVEVLCLGTAGPAETEADAESAGTKPPDNREEP